MLYYMQICIIICRKHTKIIILSLTNYKWKNKITVTDEERRENLCLPYVLLKWASKQSGSEKSDMMRCLGHYTFVEYCGSCLAGSWPEELIYTSSCFILKTTVFRALNLVQMQTNGKQIMRYFITGNWHSQTPQSPYEKINDFSSQTKLHGENQWLSEIWLLYGHKKKHN